jgi:hypothetical protein
MGSRFCRGCLLVSTVASRIPARRPRVRDDLVSELSRTDPVRINDPIFSLHAPF